MSPARILASLPTSNQELFGEPDWSSIGLAAALLGCFLIANATLFDHPRRWVERHFAPRKGRQLRTIRESIHSRVQNTLGMLFLMVGFALQLVGRFRPEPAAGEAPLSIAWVGALVLLAAVLMIGGWWWSLHVFRRAVLRHFVESPPDLLADPTTTRELGELLGIDSHPDDTIEDYAARVARRVGLTTRTRTAKAARTLPETGGGEELLGGESGASV